MSFTELDAVNEMLSAIGQTPIATLEGGQSPDTISALDVLNRTNKKLQTRGWIFNSLPSVILTPDSLTGAIQIPINWLNWKPVDKSTWPLLIERDGAFYDQENETAVFTQTIEFSVVELFPFENSPVSFQNWCLAKASSIFQDRFLGSASTAESLMRDEKEARIEFMKWENQQGGYTIRGR